MNIGQIARNQQMLYQIASRTADAAGSAWVPQTAEKSSPALSDYKSLLRGFGGGQDEASNYFSSPDALKGTVRQIAKRLYDASFSGESAGSGSTSNSVQDSLAGTDPLMDSLRKQLGSKLEAQQQLYRPDQTLSGNFEQLQAVANQLVSRLQTVNLSDETTKKIQALALEDAKNSAGAQEGGEAEGSDKTVPTRTDRVSLVHDEVQKYAPSKRSAALNTINKVWQAELDRIGAHIKQKDPNWTMWGDKFDTSILNDYKPGVNVWV